MARVHQFRFRGVRVTVTLDGDRVSVAPDGAPPRILDATAGARGAAARTRDGVWVSVDGFTAFLPFADAEHEVGAAARADEVRAPMTGTVVSVAASPGAAVTAGQVLAVLTAMKMEYRLEAPRDGTVARVDCAAGQSVELGQVLVALAPEPA